MTKLYNVGIYTRLSLEDASNSAKAKNYIPADESTSIENQKAILSQFVMLNGWIEIKTYSDDGYSGGNFNRPAFKAMMEDVKNGLINLVLVKDLSRLGRDYIEVGRYTDYVFPSLGCRFVSLLDCIDTASDNNDMMHFRSLMNDYHLKDLSNKIKSVLHAKAKSGQFLASYAPYGYQKSADDKHRLVVDEYSAEIVKQIFVLRQKGCSYGKITATLNNEGIQSPRGYWHDKYSEGECKYSRLWMYATVKIILHNEVYLGRIIQNCTGSLSYKNKKQIRKPKSEWIQNDDTHEPIITEEQWNAVQEINKMAKLTHSTDRKPSISLFSGKLICADCKTPLVASTETHKRKNGTSKSYVSYFCGRFSQSGRSVCSWHRIYEMSLQQIVTAEIKAYAQAVILDEKTVTDKLKQQMQLADNGYQEGLKQEAKHLAQRLSELDRLTAQLYEDKVARKISEDTFSVLMKKNEQERQEKSAKHDELTATLTEIQNKNLSISKWAEVVRKHINLQELDRTAIDELIDHIEIGERVILDGNRTQAIRVCYRFIGQIG